MIRNYAKLFHSLFTRMAGKIIAMTVMQYFNFSIIVLSAKLNMLYFNSTNALKMYPPMLL